MREGRGQRRLETELSLELPGRSDLSTAPWPRDMRRISARSLACFLPCVPCPSSLQGQNKRYTRASRRTKETKLLTGAHQPWSAETAKAPASASPRPGSEDRFSS